MYREIQIHTTDEKDKFLFIKDNNLIYGGFIIRDIILLLKQGNSKYDISQILSKRYNTTINQETITNIVDHRLEELFLNQRKRKSLKKIIHLNLKSNILYHRLFFFLFGNIFFYFLLSVTFLINSLFYFFFHNTVALDFWEKLIAYILLFGILIIHEFGHIISAKFHNTVVKEIGLGIYRVIPVLYVNLDEIWKLSKEKRIIINLSGIYFQSLIGIFFIFLFFIFKQNLFWYIFCANYTILFLNLNPFFQFDGYWVLTDLLNEKNLNKSSNSFIKTFIKNTHSFNVSKVVKIYSFLRITFFVYLIFHFIKNIIIYVT